MLINSQNQITTKLDSGAVADEAARQFVALYEAKAYVVYNVALRITCDAGTAMAAAESAFLAQADRAQSALIPATVEAALREAPRKPATDQGDPEHQAMLRAIAKLAPTERAALALTRTAETDAAATAAALGLGAEATSQLVTRAGEALVSATGLSPEAADLAYDDWDWAQPPAELWESLYPNYYRSLERRLVDGPQATASAAAVAAKPAKKRRRLPRLRLPRLTVILGFVLPALLVAGAVAVTQRKSDHPQQAATAGAVNPYDTFGSDGTTTPTPAPTPVDDTVAAAADELDHPDKAKPRKPLTPKELDALRMQELRELKKYEKQQADKRLTQAERDYASNKASALRDLARRRVEAERREKALARAERRQARRERALARERERQQQAGSGDGEKITVETDEGAGSPNGSSPDQGSGSQPPSDQPSQDECLQDAETGQYVCPG